MAALLAPLPKGEELDRQAFLREIKREEGVAKHQVRPKIENGLIFPIRPDRYGEKIEPKTHKQVMRDREDCSHMAQCEAVKVAREGLDYESYLMWTVAFYVKSVHADYNLDAFAHYLPNEPGDTMTFEVSVKPHEVATYRQILGRWIADAARYEAAREEDAVFRSIADYLSIIITGMRSFLACYAGRVQ